MDPALAALCGAAIGLGGAVWINTRQTKAAAKTQRRRAFAAFLGALYPAVAELREMPPNAEPNAITRLTGRLDSPQSRWLRTRKGLTESSPVTFVRMDRLAAAYAVVQTVEMPKPALAAIEAANDYVLALGEERSDELIDRWPTVREDLLTALDIVNSKRPGAKHAPTPDQT